MMTDIEHITIAEARRDLDGRTYSAMELAEAHLSRIEEKKGNNAYLEVFDDVRQQAKEADKLVQSGRGGILAGIPISVKDNILIRSRRASAGSKMLEGYRAPYDATVVLKIREAGGIFLGRTNMDEFAMGSSTENSAFGVVKNPHDEARVPGGSSGGSAASIALHTALGSLGSDTGGSIRQPASLCGVVGLKPTYGSVSRYGLIAMGSSFDQIGPLAKTVEDAEILFNVIKGNDPYDSTSIPVKLYPRISEMRKRIGVPRALLGEGIDEDVLKNFEKTLAALRQSGYDVIDIELPYAEYALPAYYVIIPAEVSTNLARFDGVRYGLHVEGKNIAEEYAESRSKGFGPEVRRRILLGTHILSAGYYDAYYTKAQAVRQLISHDYEEAFKAVDLIATPTSPTPAFKIGEKTDPISMYRSDIFTVTANLTGMPALSIPSGFVEREKKELPVGFHLTAPMLRESWLFAAGKDVQASVK
ncbi:Asp-tRNA(Asn)/Glu-tRNA(Gln) amidotransferase subunit GatA [Candidatus Kaiserbacteria bacterium]|nr:Asp-tRNA(Asn)/Glu-tRNA(Gln) amidotransferase subunit GatA [Candidatus Kaiserbacteria bacterium]